MKRFKYILFYFLLIALNGFSQNDPSPFRFWRLTALSGDIRLRGTFREYETNHESISSLEKAYYFNGLFHANTQSYFIHPNFMVLNLSGSYNPLSRRDRYIGVPDYSETYNSESLDATANFFSTKKVNLSATAILNNAIQNVENITTTQTKSRQLGSTISYSNHAFPVSVGYTKQHTEQKTLGTDSKFNFDQRLIQATAATSFTPNDNHSLSYLNTETTSELDNNPNINLPFEITNKSALFELDDNIAFDSKKNYLLTSNITNTKETGFYNYKRLYVRENLTLKLPKNLTFSNSYDLWKTELDYSNISHQTYQSSLSHKLYESFYSRVYYEYNNTDQESYNEKRNKIGFDLRYTKKIPQGKLTLSYDFYREHQQVTSSPIELRVVRADYVLNDNDIVILKSQNIVISSIVVKDVTGTILYRLNIDYILIDRDPLVEIKRIPGGMIPNNGTVYIDYTVLQSGKYDIYLNNHAFSSDLLLFKDVLDLYYRHELQDYNNQIVPENLVLNYYTRNVVGASLNFNYVKGGSEYENYSSNILPYERIKYFLSIQKMFKNVSFNINGNLENTWMKIEKEKRENTDISCKIAYTIFRKYKIDFDYMYLKMRGRGIHLDQNTTKLEVTTNFYSLYVSLGADAYWKNELNSIIHFKGIYIQLSRSF